MTAIPASQIVSARTETGDLESRVIIHVGFIAAIVLQRFGLTFGTSYLFISLPIMLALGGYMLFAGLARFRTAPTSFYLMFVFVGSLSAMAALVYPDQRVGFSIMSLLLTIATYSFFSLGPTRRFDTSKTLDIFIFYARVCAIMGIMQYILQYVGPKWFIFGEMFPFMKPILVEQFWNDAPWITWGSPYNRSNGFFLLEPSFMSQLMVMAVLVDFFKRRKLAFLPVYAIAYIMTYAGTGALALAIALPIAALVSIKDVPRMIIFGLVGLFLVTLLFVAFPQELLGLLDRSDELNKEGSSGYARYVASSEALSAFSADIRSVIGFGPGATQRSIYFSNGTMSPLYKIFVDYGYLGLIALFGTVISTLWRRDIAILSVYLIVLYQVGGGNVTVMPILTIMILLTAWSKPMTAKAGRPLANARPVVGSNPVRA